MTDILKLMTNHRSIRKWKKDPIPESLLESLFEAAMATSTSNGMQQASIIRVKNQEVRQALSELASQDYLVEAPELLVFVVDNYRTSKILEESGLSAKFAHDMDKFFQGFTDASLMAQNVALAAESQGLGIVYFGSILNDAQKTISILKLPKYTFPVVALGIGYPDQKPEKKPRMDKTLRVFEDCYHKLPSYLEALADYDQEMNSYYDLRTPDYPLPKFTDQVASKNAKAVQNRDKIMETIKNQGFSGL